METDIIIKETVTGLLSNNVYLVINKNKNESFVVDPSYHADKIIEMIEESGSSLKGILITHGHFDHIMSVSDIKEKYNVPVWAGADEKEIISDAKTNMSRPMIRKPVSEEADNWVADGEIITVAGITVKCINTPGHTVGSVCWYIQDHDILLSGDTLFFTSHGRTDFPTGSPEQMENSLKNILFKLPDHTKVYPGHGEPTTIGHEKKYNMINY